MLVDSSIIDLQAKKIELNENNSELLSFIIMPEKGLNLESLFIRRKMNFTQGQVYSLGLQILDILEQVHGAGYIYNDLKLDNFLLDS